MSNTTVKKAHGRKLTRLPPLLLYLLPSRMHAAEHLPKTAQHHAGSRVAQERKGFRLDYLRQRTLCLPPRAANLPS